LDLKKTAKIFGSKFACGTSSNEKADEIVIQGDFIDEVIDLILDKFGDKV
jgi:density-regulated protein DRP1